MYSYKSDSSRTVFNEGDGRQIISYNRIANNIRYTMTGSSSHVLAFAAVNPHALKTAVTMNIALSLAKMNEQVVLIDLNLRKEPNGFFGVNANGLGMTNVLVEDCTLDEAICPTGVGTLTTVNSGAVSPNPQMLLSSDKLTDIIELLKQKNKWVFIDLPPICSDDSLIVAPRLESTALLFNQQTDTKKNLTDAVGSIEKHNIATLGIIVYNSNTK